MKLNSIVFRKLLVLPAFITLSCLPCAYSQQASTTTWTGDAQSGDWNTAGNWDPENVPASEDNVIIQGDTTVTTSADAATDLGQLILDGSTLKLDHKLGVTGAGDPAAGGLYLYNGATMDVRDGGELSFSEVEMFVGRGSLGTLNLETGGSITANKAISIGRENGGDGVFNQTGGTLIHTQGDFIVGGFGGTGVYSISGGTAEINALRLNMGSANTGTVNQTGGAVTLTGESALGWGGADAIYNMSGGTIEAGNRLRVGIGASQRVAWFNQTGGDVLINGRIDIGEVGGDEQGAEGLVNKYSISSGSLKTTDAILVGAFGRVSGEFEVSGDAQVDTTRIQLGGGTSDYVSTLNLNGGTVKLNNIHAGGDVKATQIVNLDGTTLIAKQGHGDFIGGDVSVTIGDGGVTIDTDGHGIDIRKNLGGSGKLIKTGEGTLQLQAENNTYEGGTTISGGMIQITNASQLGAANDLTFTGVGGAIKNSDSELNFSADRNVVIDSGAKAYFVAGWGKAITINGKVTGGGDLVVSNEGGAVTLTNSANDYSGKTVIGAIPYRYGFASSALLKLGADDALGATERVIFDGGLNDNEHVVTSTLDMAGYDATITGLAVESGRAVINNTSSTNSKLSIGANDTSSTYTGEIHDDISLEKIGEGTVILAGVNNYTGETLVSAGTLYVTGTLGTSGVNVDSGASFGASNTATITSGDLHFAAGAKLDISEGLITVPSGNTVSFGGFDFDQIVGFDVYSAEDGIHTLIAGDFTLDGSNIDHFGVENAHDLGGGRYAWFESGSLNVVIIPEPGIALLSCLGVFTLLRRRRAN